MRHVGLPWPRPANRPCNSEATRGRAPRLGLAALALVATLSASGASAQPAKTPQEQAIRALTLFSVAYAAWIWEGRCHELDTAKRAAFQRQIESNLLRLNEVFEPRLVGAATASGRATAEDPKQAACTGDNAGLAAFGMEQADEAATALRDLPAGYRLKVTP